MATSGTAMGLPDQLKLRRFHALKNHSVKLFKTNQGKVLKVLRRDHPGEFDDVKTGVCAALSCVWLKSMMNFSWRSLALQEADPSLNPAQLFLGQPTSLDMAGYLTDAEVVAIHRKYKNSVKVHAEDLVSCPSGS